MRKYQVLREGTTTYGVVVIAESPEDAVAKARNMDLGRWEPIGAGTGYDPIDTVTERRKNGRAFSVERDGRCIEVEDDLPF